MENKLLFINEFNNIDKIKIFEIQVTDKRNGEVCHIIFDINIDEETDTMYAQMESLTIEQSNSNKIASVAVDIDYDFSVDEALQNLYDTCITAIIHSDYFSLYEEGDVNNGVDINARLEYLRGEIRKECISYGEIAELQSYIEFIDKDDVELLQWAKDGEE
jgi:hypothetical protein